MELELSVDDVAALLQVKPSTIRRRIRAGELRARSLPGRSPVVLLDPGRDWLRVDDVALLLGVSPATVRSSLARGELAGRQDGKTGRWRVRLESVLQDERVDRGALEVFTGERPPARELAEPETRPRHRLSRDVFVRLDQPEAELLERARATHGTIRGAVVAGLQALAGEGMSEGEAAEILAERETYRGRSERAESELRELRELARERLLDAAYCPQCERLVPAEEWEYLEVGDGAIDVFHKPHGYQRGSRLRASTVLGRRAGADDAQR